MGCLSWLIVGALGGWIASFIIKVPGRGLLGNIIAGIIGGLLVGWLVGLFFGADVLTGINLPSIIAAAVGAIVVSAAYSWFMGRGKKAASQAASSASNAASNTTKSVQQSASQAASSATTMAKEVPPAAGAAVAGAAAGAASMTKDAAAGASDMTKGAAAAVTGAAGAMNMDQMMGALNGVLGGGQLDVNSPLGQMITPIADSLTAKLGLPKELGAIVVAFGLAKLGEMMKSKGGAMPSTSGAMPPAGGAAPPAGGMGAVNTDEVLGKISSGGGVDTGTLDSMGLSQELATKTGLSKEQAGKGLQYAMGALSAGMSGQKTFEGMNLPDMSMLTGMMPK